jgi:hypothetical protein
MVGIKMKYVIYTRMGTRDSLLFFKPYEDWREIKRTARLLHQYNSLSVEPDNRIIIGHWYGDTPELFRPIDIRDIEHLANALKCDNMLHRDTVKGWVKELMIWWITNNE